MIGEKATAARASRAAGIFHQHAAEAPDEAEGADPEQPGEAPEHHFLWPQSWTIAQTVRR